MRQTYSFIIIGLLVLVTGCTRSRTPVTPQPTETASATVYCTADGTLGTTQPIQSHRSYCIKSNAAGKTFQPDQASDDTFALVDDRGDVVRDFAVVHEKIMHVIIVRKDLVEFQHVHPAFNASTGEFTLPGLTMPSDGPYRLFADFTPSGSQIDPHGNPLGVTIHEDINIGDTARYTPQPPGTEERVKQFGSYQVQLWVAPEPLMAGRETTLTYRISTPDGVAVTNLEKYLGARGHAVILRADDLQFLHTHPEEEGGETFRPKVAVVFTTALPAAGTYKIFMQFQHAGKIITTDFKLPPVAAGGNMPSEDGAMWHQ